MLPTFTPCQAKALHLLQGKGNIFLTGAAGTGKSFLLRQFLQGTHEADVPVLASTGAAAVIVGGRTFHSFFGLGILEGGKDATVGRALRSGPLHRRLQNASCVVIDEVSMLSGETLAIAEEIARHIRGVREPWGGLRIIAVGDFAQLPPVQSFDRSQDKLFERSQDPDASQEIGAPARDWGFLHPVWKLSAFQPAYLRTTVRTTEPKLLSVLNKVREGSVDDEVREFLRDRTVKPDPMFDGTRLFPHRGSADAYNRARLERLPGDPTSFATLYEGAAPDVAKLQKQCPIPEALHLKRGALVMLRKNDVTYPYAYVNGTLGTVTQIEEENLTLRLASGEHIDIPRMDFSLLDGNGSVRAIAHNFPVTLAWATTIHKAQGASIDRLMVSMNGLWESGHAYVALSRARSEHGLFIEQWDERNIMVDPLVQAFYAEVQSTWDRLAATLPDTAPEMVVAPAVEKKRPRVRKEKKMANHLQTAEFLSKQIALEDIADALGWTVGTIAGHVERLVKEGRCPDIAYLRQPLPAFEEIVRLFSQHGTEKLSPVFYALEGRYSFDDLKVVRALMAKDKKRETAAINS